MNASLLIAVLIYELILIVGVGYWVTRTKLSSESRDAEFTLGGRQLTLPLVAATLALTVLGTPHIMGIFEMAWRDGATAMWFSIAHVFILVAVCLTTGLWMRRTGVNSVPQLLEDMFSPGIRMAVSCVMAGSIFGVLTLETQGLAILLSTMTGWSIQYAGIAGGILGVLYVVLAGMKEVGWVNVFNAVLMYVSVILATIFIALSLPGGDFSSVADYYVANETKDMLSIYTPGMWAFMGLVIALIFSQPANQPLLQTCMAAKDEKTIKRALWIAAPVNGMFGVFICVIGLTAKSIPEFEVLGPKIAATTMLVNLLPTWLVIFLIGSFMAAILSSFAMTALAPATIFSNDIYKRYYKPDATEKQIANNTRLVIVVLAVIAVAVGSLLPTILASVGWVLAWLMPVLWLLVSGLFWKRSTKSAAITLGTVWIMSSLWSFTNIAQWMGLDPNQTHAYMMLALTIIVGVITNLIFPGRERYFDSERYQQQVAAGKT